MHLCQGPENSMKTVNSLPPPEDCNCFAVRAAARRVSQCYDRFLAPTDLRTTQYSILARLKRKGPLTINALAEAMVMDRTTLGRNILPLQRDGLITIKSAASDRRAKELRLTKAGEKRLQEAFEGWSQAQARDRKSTRLNSSHANISYAVFCLKKKNAMRPPIDCATTAGRSRASAYI